MFLNADYLTDRDIEKHLEVKFFYIFEASGLNVWHFWK
jgi:hypothetical protein